MLDHVESAKIVQTEDVVCMWMCNEYGVQSCNIVFNTLESLLRCGIDEDIAAIFTNKYRGAHPLVFRIV